MLRGQLERGTRKALGKESLIVFDLRRQRRALQRELEPAPPDPHHTLPPRGLVLAPEGRIADEDARGEAPPVVLNLGIWAKGLEEIDTFDWQSQVKDMLSVSDLELALATAE